MGVPNNIRKEWLTFVKLGCYLILLEATSIPDVCMCILNAFNMVAVSTLLRRK